MSKRLFIISVFQVVFFFGHIYSQKKALDYEIEGFAKLVYCDTDAAFDIHVSSNTPKDGFWKVMTGLTDKNNGVAQFDPATAGHGQHYVDYTIKEDNKEVIVRKMVYVNSIDGEFVPDINPLCSNVTTDVTLKFNTFSIDGETNYVNFTYRFEGESDVSHSNITDYDFPIHEKMSKNRNKIILVALEDRYCTSTSIPKTFEITINESPDFSIDGPTGICTNQMARLEATNNSGWQYIWSNGSTGSSIDVDAKGDYTLNVIDENECTTSKTHTITDIFTNPEVKITGGSALCEGEKQTIDATVNSDWTYAWSKGTTLTDSVRSSLVVSEPDVYRVDVVDKNSCSGYSTINLNNIFPKPDFTISGDNVICTGDTKVLTANGNSLFSYEWNTTETTTSINVTAGGTYTCTATEPIYNCSNTKTFELQEATPPNLSFTVDSACKSLNNSDVNIVFTGNPPFSIICSEDGTDNTVSNITEYNTKLQFGNKTNTIIKSVTDNFCNSTINQNIDFKFYETPTADMTGGGDICNNGETASISVKFTGNSPWNFKYTDGTDTFEENNIASDTFDKTVKNNGTYEITEISDKNCPGTFTNNARVTVRSLPKATLTVANINLCKNSEVEIPITLVGEGPFSVTYNDGNNDTEINNISESNFKLLARNSGVYTLKSVKDSWCFSDKSPEISGTTTITDVILPELSITSSDFYCINQGASVDIEATPTGGEFYINNEKKSTLDISATGNNTIKYKYSESGCSDSVSKVIEIIGDAEILNDNSICTEDSVLQLKGFPKDGVFTVNGSNQATLDLNMPGTYNLLYTAPDNRCPSSSQTKTMDIVVHPKPSYTVAEKVFFCEDSELNLNVETDSKNIVKWENGTLNNNLKLSSGKDTTIAVVITSDKGCIDSTKVTGVIKTKSKAVNDTVQIPKEATQVSFNIADNDSGNYNEYTILSEPFEGNLEIEDNGEITFSLGAERFIETYAKYSVVTQDCEQHTSEGHIVFVRNNINVTEGDKTLNIFIPNIMSPNGDGDNDYLYIEDIENYEKNSIEIFSEDGKLIFKESPYNQDWEGKSNTGIVSGGDLPNGTYFYIVRVDSFNPVTGFIELRR